MILLHEYYLRVSSAFAMCLVLVSLIYSSNVNADDDPITVFFEETPPYFMGQGAGSIAGFAGSLVSEILAKSDQKIRFQASTFNRIFARLRAGEKNVCAAGYSDRDDRREYLQISEPFMISAKHVVLHRAASSQELEKYASVSDVLEHSVLHGAFQSEDDWPEFGPLIKNTNNRHLMLPASDEQQVRLVTAGRVDFVLMEGRSAEHYIRMDNSGVPLAITSFPDLDSRYELRILCTKETAAGFISSIDSSLAARTDN